jgi:anaerobic magnesium-protoporphyrin IX monomethyl ester cyclase
LQNFENSLQGDWKIKACFINPPVRDFYTTSIRRQPLGLLYVMAAVRSAGHDVVFINGHSPKKRALALPDEFSYLKKYMDSPDPARSFPFRNYSHFGMSFDEIKQRIVRADADIFFIPSQFTPYHGESDRLINMARQIKPEAPVVTGGHHAALHPGHLLTKAGADFVVLGAGEESSVALLSCLAEGGDPSGIPGLACRRGGETIMTGRRMDGDIDALPHPARDLLLGRDFTAYRRRAVAMISSRGCPNRCGFCTVGAIWGHRYLTRSVDSVLAEIAECVSRYGADMINFEDDNLFATRERAALLLEGLAAYQESSGAALDLTAMNGVSLEKIDDGIVALMRRAGFREINISLMSRSAELQEAHGRPFSSERFARVALAARRLDMNVRAYFILGLPGQTVEEARESIEFLRSLDVKFFPSVYYNVKAPEEEWMMQRSSAFYNETDEMTRDDLIRIFNECREIR